LPTESAHGVRLQPSTRLPRRFQPDAVVSTGFCGALDPQLALADVVVATSVAAANRSYQAVPVTSAAAHHSGVVRSIDQ